MDRRVGSNLSMKTLLILRHAKSSWSEGSQDDFDRPLNERGKRDAPRVGQALVEQGLVPDLVLASSAKRARKTAKKVIESIGQPLELRLIDELYLATPATYLSHLRRLEADFPRVLIVGHNPGLEELLSQLTGRYEQLATAALAQVELPIDSWNEISGNGPAKLVSLWRPSD